MKTLLIGILSLATAVLAGAELTPDQTAARKALDRNAAMEEYPGGIFAQARIDGIDYRPILHKAISLDQEALHSLLRMNFMGEGGETHAENLLLLMELWGDNAFAKALKRQSPRIRRQAIRLIDDAWADSGWNRYPSTLALSPGSIRERPQPE